MLDEVTVPLAKRCLLVQGLVADATYVLVKSGLPVHWAKTTVCCFVSFSYADLPLGKAFDCVCAHNDYRNIQRTPCVIVAVTQQFGRPFDLVPHGWKTICLCDFPDGIPSLVQHLPLIDDWYDSSPDRQVVLCSNETWAALTGDACISGGSRGTAAQPWCPGLPQLW